MAGRENCYIAMADRWLPGYKVDGRIADLFTRVIGSSYEPEKYQATDEERREMYDAGVLESADTSVSDYVWRPLRIEKPEKENMRERIYIEWKNTWKIEEI